MSIDILTISVLTLIVIPIIAILFWFYNRRQLQDMSNKLADKDAIISSLQEYTNQKKSNKILLHDGVTPQNWTVTTTSNSNEETPIEVWSQWQGAPVITKQQVTTSTSSSRRRRGNSRKSQGGEVSVSTNVRSPKPLREGSSKNIKPTPTKPRPNSPKPQPGLGKKKTRRDDKSN